MRFSNEELKVLVLKYLLPYPDLSKANYCHGFSFVFDLNIIMTSAENISANKNNTYVTGSYHMSLKLIKPQGNSNLQCL